MITGWTGSTAKAEVAEWIEASVGRIQGLAPRRLLEIGCGTGQLLSRFAPVCETCWGLDFSRTAIEALEARFETLLPDSPGRVRLFCRQAHDLEGIPIRSFDTVVINSVAQYFPDADYLERVLDGALGAAADGGVVFVGDVQSLAMLETFHADAQLGRADDATPADALRTRLAERLALENELVLDPAFFLAFAARRPRVTGVTFRARRGRLLNETTRFHYDVTLHTGAARPAPDVRTLAWGEGVASFGRSPPRSTFRRGPSS